MFIAVLLCLLWLIQTILVAVLAIKAATTDQSLDLLGGIFAMGLYLSSEPYVIIYNMQRRSRLKELIKQGYIVSMDFSTRNLIHAFVHTAWAICATGYSIEQLGMLMATDYHFELKTLPFIIGVAISVGCLCMFVKTLWLKGAHS